MREVSRERGEAHGQEDHVAVRLLRRFLSDSARTSILADRLRMRANPSNEPGRGANLNTAVVARAVGTNLGGDLPDCVNPVVFPEWVRPNLTVVCWFPE